MSSGSLNRGSHYQMNENRKRMVASVLFGLVFLAGVLWLLGDTLGNVHETLFAGRPLAYWSQQLDGRDLAASNRAYAVVHARVVPQLLDTMLRDTNDSKIRMAAIDLLNGLPGLHINYAAAGVRRNDAAECLGELGPAAKFALPDLIQALKGNDSAIREGAIKSLGKMRSDPETVIPILIPYLDDENLDAAAAKALAEFGALAKPAVPKLLTLLQAKDVEDRAAAIAALRRIDPLVK